jgi:hypothetical protein
VREGAREGTREGRTRNFSSGWRLDRCWNPAIGSSAGAGGTFGALRAGARVEGSGCGEVRQG